MQTLLFSGLTPKPVIVPRPDHCVSRKDMDREALKVLYRLKDHGFIAYLVGGSVRDLLLGKKPKDFDIGTNARPEEVKRIFRYSRIIGKRFRIVHVYFRGGKVIEVSTFRRQSDYDDREAMKAGIGEQEIFGSPREDAFRRDLTINGLFYNIADFSIIDYVGGIRDLHTGTIRTIGDPDHRFLRDPVRMLRAVRHAARTGFAIEKKTLEAIRRHCDTIRLCAIARVRDEWLKDLSSGCASEWVKQCMTTGLFASLFPVYSGLFRGSSSGRAADLLLYLLDRLDQMTLEGRVCSEALKLALFLYPGISVMDQWQGLNTPKLRWPTYEVRSMVDELLLPYDFRRSVRDGLAQVLSNQWPIGLCHENNRLPKRVWKKTVFNEALLLYNMIREFQGRPLMDVSWQNGTARYPVEKKIKKPKPPPKRRRRRRSRRRNR